MRKTLVLLLAVFLLSAVPSFAFDDHAPFEFFVGYNFVRLLGEDEAVSMNGWNMAFTGNINSILGIKGEISGAYRGEDIYDRFGHISIKERVHSFMAGPQINARFEALPGAASIFGHALFGVGNFGINAEACCGASLRESVNLFAMALGGGIDWGKGRVGLRAPQIDYFPLRKTDVNLNNFRISAGLVFRFGQ